MQTRLMVVGVEVTRLHSPAASGVSAASCSAAWMALALLTPWMASAAPPAPSVDDAYQAYRRGRFGESQGEYAELAKERPDDGRLRFNAGAAAYRQNDLTNAARWFESVVSAPDLRLQQQAYYNLGNTRFRLGEGIQDPQARQQLWQEAITNFSAAAQLDTLDTNAVSNLAFVRQKLQELQQQMPPPQQQPKQNQKDPKKDQKKDQPKDQPKDQSKDQQSQDPSKGDGSDGKSDGKPQSSQDQKGDGSEGDPSTKDSQDPKGRDAQKESGKPEPKPGDPQGAKEGEPKKEGGEKSGAGETPGTPGDQESAAQEAGEGKPGELTQAQAVQLLENQKADEKALMLRSYGGNKASERSGRTVRKPW